MRLDFCVACGAKKKLHHHHIVPKSVLPDPDRDPSRVITLCHRCHCLIHEKKEGKAIGVNHGKLIAQGIRKRKAQGKHYGPIPFGFTRVEGELLPDGMEQKVLRMLKTRKNWGWSFAKLAEWLESEGIQTRKGGRWDRAGVRKMMIFNDEFWAKKKGL